MNQNLHTKSYSAFIHSRHNSLDRSTIPRTHTWVLKSVSKIDPKLILGNDIKNAPRIILPSNLESVPPYIIIQTRVVHCACVKWHMFSVTTAICYSYRFQQQWATTTDSNNSELQLQITICYRYRWLTGLRFRSLTVQNHLNAQVFYQVN